MALRLCCPPRDAGFALIMAAAITTAAPAAGPPVTPERPVVETVHGVRLTDRFRWLEDGKNAEVQAWTRRQHDATLAWLEANAPPVAGLHDELTAYFDRDITQPPFFKRGREFFYRTRKGEEQAKVYTRLDERELLLFDPIALDPSGKTSVGAFVLNRNASRAAVATYSRGSEITDYRIIDTRTGEQIGPLLPGIGAFHWARDERYAYVSPRTKESIERQEPQRCYRHALGDDPKNDELLVTMTDAKDWCSVYDPEEAEVTVFETGDFYSNTIRIRPADSKAEPETIYTSKEFRATADFRQTDARVGEIRATIARKTVRAPFSGILGIRHVNLGQYLSAGDALVTLQSLNPIYVNFAVPQQALTQVHAGRSVRVTAGEAADAEFTGKISAIDSIVNESTRNVQAQATLANPLGRLRPGMFVQTEVILGATAAVISVPASAISYAPFGDSVFVVSDLQDPHGKTYRGVRQVFVKLGGARGDQVAIVSGLKPGDEVVTSGVFKLRNGAAVLVNNKIRPGNSPAPKPENS